VGERNRLEDRQASLVLERRLAALAGEEGDVEEATRHTPELGCAELVQRLLAGAPVNVGELGYDLDTCHLGVIASGVGAREVVRMLAVGTGRQLLTVQRGNELVWAWFGWRRQLPVTEIERLLSRRADPAGVSLAIGEPGDGIDGWRLTHWQARAALRVLLRSPQRLTRFADVALLALALSDRPLACSLQEMYLSPLGRQKDGGAASRETLRAYFVAGNNAATAAAALGVDRHTVERRLRLVERELGRALRTCQAELEVALRLEELDGVFSGENASHVL
jgi:sugar diacid utilization regulator